MSYFNGYPDTYLSWCIASTNTSISDATKEKHYALMEAQAEEDAAISNMLARRYAEGEAPSYALCERAPVPQHQLDSDNITRLLEG